MIGMEQMDSENQRLSFQVNNAAEKLSCYMKTFNL